jgi:hypothetical protein
MISTRRLSELDRRAGQALREIVNQRPEALRVAQVGSEAFAPTFRLAVAAAVMGRATSASKAPRGIGATLWVAMVIGSACRVATGEHEVGDVVAGAALGVLVAASFDAVAGAPR